MISIYGEIEQIIITITIDLPTISYHWVEKSENILFIGMNLRIEWLRFAFENSIIIPQLKNYVTKLDIRIVESDADCVLYPILSINFLLYISSIKLIRFKMTEQNIEKYFFMLKSYQYSPQNYL